MRWWVLLERELTVAARRPRLYGLRLGTAALAALLCGWKILTLQPTPGRASLATGLPLFHALADIALVYALLAGIFVTADLVSEERRNGTLSLLAITEVRLWHVIFAKTLASILAATVGLLAIVPTLGFPLLLGGVSPGEVLRTAGGILNALWFSLSAGLFASACSRQQSKAIFGAAALILGIAALIPGLTALGVASWVEPRTAAPILQRIAWVSPSYITHLAFDSSFSRQPVAYWTCLGVTHGLGWMFWIGSWILTALHWKEDPSHQRPPPRWLLRLGYTRWWKRRFQRRLEQNPIFAAAARARWPVYVFWGLVLLVTFNVIWLAWAMQKRPIAYSYHQRFAYALIFLNRVWVAVLAIRFFQEAKRTGASELLAISPLPDRTILRGHFRAILAYLSWPVLAIAGLHVLYVILRIQAMRGLPLRLPYYWEYYSVQAAGSFVNFLTDILAICLLGTALSLRIRHATVSVLLTVGTVFLLPLALRTLFPQSMNLLPPSTLQNWIQTLFPMLRVDIGVLYVVAQVLTWTLKNILICLGALWLLRPSIRLLWEAYSLQKE